MRTAVTIFLTSLSTLLHAETQTWECVPSVITSDGTTSFRIEVTPNRPVQQVYMEEVGYGFSFPELPILFNDGGVNPDQVAGDGVWTSPDFRYDNEFFAPRLNMYNDINSPIGLDIIWAGNILIKETDNSVTNFLVQPSVGVVDPSMPIVEKFVLSENILKSRYIINVKSECSDVQGTLREVSGDISRITKKVYEYVPDSVDFFLIFSTSKTELVPSNTYANYNAGKSIKAKIDVIGTSTIPFSSTRIYGSNNKLMSIGVFDYKNRGVYSSYIMHEILHHYQISISATRLNKSDPEYQGYEIHYNPRSSVGSLLGGFLWDFDGSSYKINCNEGTNFATKASDLDKYAFGLTDCVHDIHIYPDHYPLLPLWDMCNQVINEYDTVTLDDIQSELGVRPLSDKREYNLVCVVESSRPLNDLEMTFYDTLCSHLTKTVDNVPTLGFNWVSINRFFDEIKFNSEIRTVDLNNDGLINGDDVDIFKACATRSMVPQTDINCLKADFDFDMDVDQDDFGMLQSLLKY